MKADLEWIAKARNYPGRIELARYEDRPPYVQLGSKERYFKRPPVDPERVVVNYLTY